MIFHIDLDSFYASAERLRNPLLHNIPIAVGGRSDLKLFDKTPSNIKLMNSNSGAFVAPVFHTDKKLTNEFYVDKNNGSEIIRGVIVTSSYEARAKGVRTGMSIKEALGYCPTLKVIPPDHLYYHELSHKLFLLLCKLIPNVEQFSIDEFFCDISGMQETKEPLKFALHVKEKIKQNLNLPVSIGICEAKWIAKMATDDAKPDGILHVPKNEILKYIDKKPINKFPGIGKGFEKRLKARGIYTLGECAKAKNLFDSWKLPGQTLYKRLTGTDDESTQKASKRKSIGISRTFDPIKDREELKRRIIILSRHIAYMTCKLHVNPTFFYLKIRYEYREKNSSSQTSYRLFSEKVLKETMLKLFEKCDTYKHSGVIYIALSVGAFLEYSKKSLDLVEFDHDNEHKKITDISQIIRDKYGLSALRYANEL